MRIYQTILKSLKFYSFHLILLPVFFIYIGYNQLFGFLIITNTFFNFLFILISVLICYLLFKFFMKSSQKSAIFTFIFFLLILGFGYLHDTLKDFFPGSAIIKYKYILPSLLLFISFIFVYLKYKKNSLSGTVLYLNSLMIVLNLSEIPASIYKYQINKESQNLIDYRFSVYNEYYPSKKLTDSLKPDIYFLVFDEMSSTKTLQSAWNIDNSRIDSFLNNKGFYIAKNAESNYSWTVHSISTTFNMVYLPTTLIPVLNDTKSYFWSTNSVLNNSLTSILTKEKYKIFQYQPISFDNRDWPFEPAFNQYRKYHYFYKTLPGRIYRDLFWNITNTKLNNFFKGQLKIVEERNNNKNTYLNYTISKVKESTTFTQQNKFVYGHFSVPHDPFIYDSTGVLLPPIKTVVKNNKDLLNKYKNQLYYADKLIMDIVTYIQTHNKKNTIIIVEGDHGFRYYTHEGQKFMYQNMNAIYFPDKKYDLLYDSLCPANTFRIILNKYFGTQYTLLKNETFFVPEQKKN